MFVFEPDLVTEHIRAFFCLQSSSRRGRTKREHRQAFCTQGDEAGPGRQVRFGGNEPEVRAMERWQNEPERGVYKWSRAIFTKRSQPVKTPREQQVICEARFSQHHRGALTRSEGRNLGPQVQVVFLQIGSGHATTLPCPPEPGEWVGSSKRT